ncbi:fluoride efflux transporter CrcB [candidate division KSB1 bacterium]|nr:fluoride efflux transporter CrcB [candidate division KSB1 bacterium]
MLKVLIIGFGGFIGALLRYWVGGWIQTRVDRPGFPFGTLAVNLIGCLLIGLITGWAEYRQLFSPQVRMFLLVGFVGSFTTFSTFAFETLNLMSDRQWILAGVNIGLQVIIGLIMVWIGYHLSRYF